MNLFEMLTQSQGGNGLQSLGQQFGLNQQQTQSAVEALLPAFSKGLQQTASSPQGLGALLTMLAGGQNIQGTDAGNGVLGQIFGSKDLSRAVATQASQASGVGSDILKKMLPVIATALVGGMAKQTNQQPQGGNNPLGDILEQVVGSGRGAQQPAQPQRRAQPAPQSAPQARNPLEDILGKMFNPGGAQGPAQDQGYQQSVDDIFAQYRQGMERHR